MIYDPSPVFRQFAVACALIQQLLTPCFFASPITLSENKGVNKLAVSGVLHAGLLEIH
jgi:hypothetical protein